MNKDVALCLNALNERFYQEVHESFSATRENAWPGWERALPYLYDVAQQMSKPLHVLDVACGNMRFEKFLYSAGLSCEIEAHCLDSCEALAEPSLATRFTQLDIVQALIESPSSRMEDCFPRRAYDLVACFGFFHHVPSFEARLSLLDCIIDSLRPGGVAIVSFWRFMSNERLAGKAIRWHEMFCKQLAERGFNVAGLEEGDYLLGWQGRADVCRYCHHFESEEVSRYVSSVKDRAELVDRYYADGRDGQSNEYLVLRRRDE